MPCLYSHAMTEHSPFRYGAWTMPLLALSLLTLLVFVQPSGSGFLEFFWASSSQATATTQTTVPNVLIGGTQKAGTTSIAYHLLNRCDVCGANPNADPTREAHFSSKKEPHFFDQDDALARGIAPYAQLFAHCRRRRHTRVVLDATPAYMRYPERVRTIYEELNETEAVDNLKIVFILREPVSRELSRHNHILELASRRNPPEYAKWAKPITFEEHMEKKILPQIKNRTNRSLYAHWLQQWLHAGFDRQQIFITSYDDLVHDPDDLLERLHAFLELPPPRQGKGLPWRNSKRGKHQIVTPCEVQEKLAQEYKLANQELYDWLEANPGPDMERRPFPEFEFKCRQ